MSAPYVRAKVGLIPENNAIIALQPKRKFLPKEKRIQKMQEYDKVQIYLSDGRVLKGELNIVGEPRLTDALNDSHQFIALKNVIDHRGQNMPFIILNRSHIVSVQQV